MRHGRFLDILKMIVIVKFRVQTRMQQIDSFYTQQCSILQVTALMGAHSLGNAHKQDSGYSGTWTTGSGAAFNNEYYQLLINSDLTFSNVVGVQFQVLEYFDLSQNTSRCIGNHLIIQPLHITQANIKNIRKSTTDAKWQWELFDSDSEQVGFMINTDIELVADIDVDDLEGTSCTLHDDCTEADTYSTVLEYATVSYITIF